MWRLIPLVAIALVGFAGPASAHAGGDPGPPGWSVEPWLAVLLAAASVAYAIGLWRLRRGGSRFRSWRGASFAAGILTLVAALMSPLDALAEDLFSAHMVQHLMLMLAAAPLFALARPGIVFLWAMPRPLRRASLRLTRRGATGSVAAALTHPLTAWVLFNAAFMIWHLPGPYQAALASPGLHVLEHASFFLTAYAFWAVIVAPAVRRPGYGGRLFYLTTAAILGGLPGALLILASRPFYPAHAAGVAKWGMTLVGDQQLAGLIMWIPAGAIYLAAASVLFVLWLRETGRRIAAAPLLRLAPLALLVLVVLPGCSRSEAAPDFGDPQNGATLIKASGCGACHTIPGINGAHALVGPPLDHMASRGYIAGLLRNTPDNMITWLLDPQAIVPNNVMPDLGLTEPQARDIAAYLFTLD